MSRVPGFPARTNLCGSHLALPLSLPRSVPHTPHPASPAHARVHGTHALTVTASTAAQSVAAHPWGPRTLTHRTLSLLSPSATLHFCWVQWSIAHVNFSDCRGRISLKLPRCDLYVAGPPCPEFAQKGPLGGDNTERGQLIYEAMRYVTEREPSAFCIESVSSLKSRFRECWEKAQEGITETIEHYSK